MNQPLYKQLAELPKVELHRHLEGSLTIKTMLWLAKEFKINLPSSNTAELEELVLVKKQMNSLQEVLAKFDLARSFFVNQEAIEHIAYSTCMDAARDNIKLLELRFSPGYIAAPFHHRYDDILDAVRMGVDHAIKETGISVGLIIICSRDQGIEIATKTIDFAISHKNDVVGIDLAGDESVSPELFADVFSKAKSQSLKVTAHAAEMSNPGDITKAVRLLHADRIGHGIQAIHDPAVLNEIISSGILLEVSPTSNYITNAVPSIELHPLKRLYDLGVNISINSDDPGLFGICLTDEYLVCIEKLGMTMNDLKKTIVKSLEASFIDEKEKERVRNLYFKG